MEVYVSWAISDFGDELEASISWDDDTQLMVLNYHLEDITNTISAWVENRRGKNLLCSSTTGMFLVEPEHLHELPQLIGLLESICPLHFHFGVGMQMQESNTAMKYALNHGDHVSLYDDEMLDKPEDDDPLLKSDDGELKHPEKEGQAALDMDDPTEVIMNALNKIRDNADAIEKLKQSNPQAYEAFRNITKAMVAMAKQIAEVKQAAEGEANQEESVKKAEELAKVGITPEQSNHIGSESHYNNLSNQLQYMNHVKTEQVAPNLYHHVFQAGPEGELHSHTLSQHKDPELPPLAQMHGSLEEHMGKPGFAISTVAVHPQSKGGGFGKALYLSALKHHGKMMSDYVTSSKADHAWGWLASQHGVQAQMAQPSDKMGRHVATFQKSEEMQKAIRLPKPKKTPKRITVKFPEAPAAVGSTAGTVNKGKIKTTSVDPETGAPSKEGWNGVRSGMIMGPKGSAVSSREPNTE